MHFSGLILENIFEEVLLGPARRGARELYISTGQASASMVTQHFEALSRFTGSSEVSIDLKIGMTGKDGLGKNALKGLQSIPAQIGPQRFSCTLKTRGSSDNSKVYVWCDDSGPLEAFIGSSDYTQVGFGIVDGMRNHQEVFSRIDPVIAFDFVLSSSKSGISYKSPDVADYIDLHDDDIFSSSGSPVWISELKSDSMVELPLVMTSGAGVGEVHSKSGLNWGQREGRNPNQAYIPIPSPVSKSGFFPNKGVHFQVLTDDGEAFICTIAQDGGKALQTPSDNSILGKYFRKKLGLLPGSFIQREHLRAFGSDVVRVFKEGEDTYRLVFQPGQVFGSSS